MSIRFSSVNKSFGAKKVLIDFNFVIQEGEIVFILGRSGMGKSVTLKHIIGLLRPDSGHIYVENLEVSRLSEAELAPVRRRCGMVFQQPALLDSLNIFENVAFGLRDAGLGPEQIRDQVIAQLRLVRLGEEILERFPTEISYGMQKRVSLARTLALKPKYLLFDEPTTGLDPITTNSINDLIFDLSKKLGVTSVVVSHDINCALKIADRILILDQGKILALGTVAEIRESSEPLVRDFLLESRGVA